MQWCIDLFFNIIYKIICVCVYVLFHHILWYPFYYFFFFYILFKKLFFKFLNFLYFEFFVRKPKKKIIIVATFLINCLLAIFCSIPLISFVFFIQLPVTKRFRRWNQMNPNMYPAIKSFYLSKLTVLLFLLKLVAKYIYSIYMIIWIFFLNFFFHDVFQKRRIIYKKFVLIRTFLVKMFMLCFAITSDYFDKFYNFFFCTFLGIEYNYWDFDCSYTYIYILISCFNYVNIHCMYTVICTYFFQSIQLFNLDELLIFLNLNYTYEYFTPIKNKIYYGVDFFLIVSYLQDLAVVCQRDYLNIPIFFFFGFLFFITVFISWVFLGFLSLNGLFKLNLISLFSFWVSLLFYIKPIFFFNKVYNIKISNWFFISNDTFLDYYFLIDSISFSFILLTITIALYVFIYAFSYFRYEPLVDRFLLFLLSFVISMVFLVSSGNLIMLFLGWELIGLTSFFLINFWTAKTATLKSAFKAFSFNKFSDFFIFIFIVCLYNLYFTMDILTISHLIYKNQHTFICFGGFTINSIEFLSFILLIAAFIKSAQIGGHIWLPDSMEAPVPASALIHSATLVSAGIYLLLRFNFLFDYSHNFKIIAPLFGSITAAYGGICAMYQTDLKKTLAYSTISHCGFLVILSSLELNEFVILYLYIHGFFKAILFMCIGNVLRISMNYQDFRRMGGLFKYLPFDYFCSLICVFNLAGLPFTFGFFAKHLLFLNLTNNIYIYYIILFNSFLGAISGLFYSYNLLYGIFFDFKKGDKLLYMHLNNKKYFSKFYVNSSVGSTIGIFTLLVSSYALIFFLYKNLLVNNFLFSEYISTILYNNYYSFICLNLGFSMNFFFINSMVLSVSMYLFLKKKRKVMYIYIQKKLIFSFILILSLLLIFLK